MCVCVCVCIQKLIVKITYFFSKGHFANASKSLDLGLSHNLSISEWPLYNLLNGLVHKHFERNNDCIQALENSLNNLSSNIFHWT